MYANWTKVTERDLIQKGASYNRVKTALKLEKVVLNTTLPNISNALPGDSKGQGKSQAEISKKASTHSDVLNLYVMSLLAIVAGQRPILTKARKSISNWKIRKDQILGCKVTLRGNAGWEFLDKTIRFQNINEQDMFASENASRTKKSASNYTLQSLGNVGIGIQNINFYPELEDLWIAQNLGPKKIGLDMSVSFKSSKELSQVISYILRKPGGKKLVENYAENIQAFPTHIQTNKYVLALKNIIQLRKMYLTALGLVFV